MFKVLIVDDSITMRQQVGLTLSKEGFETEEAENGKNALEILKKDSSIGMVFLDVNMPIMGGLELLEILNKDESLKKIPVVMLTTEIDKEKIDIAKQSGAKGWIIKPFEPNQVISVAQKFALSSGE